MIHMLTQKYLGQWKSEWVALIGVHLFSCHGWQSPSNWNL